MFKLVIIPTLSLYTVLYSTQCDLHFWLRPLGSNAIEIIVHLIIYKHSNISNTIRSHKLGKVSLQTRILMSEYIVWSFQVTKSCWYRFIVYINALFCSENSVLEYFWWMSLFWATFYIRTYVIGFWNIWAWECFSLYQTQQNLQCTVFFQGSMCYLRISIQWIKKETYPQLWSSQCLLGKILIYFVCSRGHTKCLRFNYLSLLCFFFFFLFLPPSSRKQSLE